MTDDWEGSDCGLTEVLLQHLSGGTEEDYEILIIASVLAWIWAKDLQKVLKVAARPRCVAVYCGMFRIESEQADCNLSPYILLE